MSTVRFDTAAFRTFEDDLTLLKTHLLYVFLCSVTSRDGSRVLKSAVIIRYIIRQRISIPVSIVRACELIARNARVYRGDMLTNISS